MAEDSVEKTSPDESETAAPEALSQRGANPPVESVAGTLSSLRTTLKEVEFQLHQLESQLQGNAHIQYSIPRPNSVYRTSFLILATLVTILVVGVRFYKLNTVQTDLYGDIQIVVQYVEGVRMGTWPFQFVLGVGPLYHYLIQPILLVTGLNYLGLKISAVVTSLAILLVLYALTRKLVDEYFALLAVSIAGISSWLLIFSRLGISLILVPLLVVLALWFMVRFIQDQQPIDMVACALVSACGWYSYPASFILPFVSFFTLLALHFVGHPITWKDIRLFVIASVIGALPFAGMVFKNPDDFIHGYIGSKFFAEGSAFGALLHNIASAALAYHFKGDGIFRSNPIFQPHVDLISGLLFFAGIFFWLQPARRRWSPLLLVPFVLLHIPSVMVLGRPGEVPSAGRTLGVAPIAYILVASGIWLIIQFFAHLRQQRLGVGVAVLCVGVIFVLNMQHYFGDYISGLPYNDTSIGGRIAVYADSLPAATQVYIVGCCWEASMPEFPFVQLVSINPQNMHQLDPSQLTCDTLAALPGPAVLIWSFHDPLPSPQLDACKQWLPTQLYVSPKGLPVFNAAPLLRE
jgi:hypothetical protein